MSIELIDIRKSFGSKSVLKGMSFRVEDGETLSMVGFSGTGKSVTLKHVAGLLKPDSGTVMVGERNVASLTREQLYEMRREMGFVFQFAALFDSMTIAENVAMGLQKQGVMNDAEIRERVAESLARVELEGYEERFPSELSGGQQKRAGLARAIAFRPKYLLYDEPTSGLDPVTTTVIDELILKMQKDLGVTSLVITHDMASANRISNRIAMLFEGRVLEIGTPEEIRATENPIVRGFIEGRPELVEKGRAQSNGAGGDESRTEDE
jgi:phospholipid/cholesterol/gamma-HCH transport system ATP-binding protein